MIYYSEEKRNGRSVFVKTVKSEDGSLSTERVVKIPMYQIDRDGFTTIMLFDDTMTCIHDVYRYLNYGMKDSPLTTRLRAAAALRLLYCFLSLSNYDVEKLGEKELRELVYFLRGIGTMTGESEMKTQRTNGTVNGYLAAYRSFFKYTDIQCEPLFDSHDLEHINAETSAYADKSYDINLAVNTHKKDEVPKYISVPDFHRIYKVITEAEDKQAQLIVHLMYGYGLRLGEVLGITTEDLTEERRNGILVPMILLRNRVSDAPDQYCKGLPHVADIKQYRRKDYIACTQEIVITYKLYEELLGFIEENHEELAEKYPDNYEKGYADVVSAKDAPEYNHYVFLNSWGGVLTRQAWNIRLRRYFEQAGIPVDTGTRENNLSHRFRHGFAMFHARFSEHPVGVLELQKMLRHKSAASTMIYYNLTVSDEFEIKTEFQDELYKVVPELDRGVV